MNVRKGDTVKVITGKYRDKKGEVKLAIPAENKVVVQGVNVVKKHMKARSSVRQAGIIEIEKPISISNIMVVCPTCGEAIRIGHRVENNVKVRYCKNPACGATIPDNTQWRTQQTRDRE